jgi:hypothetical protein
MSELIKKFVGRQVALESPQLVPTAQGPIYPIVNGRLKSVEGDVLEMVLEGDDESSLFVLQNLRSVRLVPSDLSLKKPGIIV